MMKITAYLAWAAVLLAVFLTACVEVNISYQAIPPGPWRGVLKLESNRISANPKGQPLPEKLNLTFDEVTQGELPFNFEVVYENDSSFYFNISNGDEIMRSQRVSFGRTRARAKDTIRLDFPEANAYLSAFYEENLLEGVWVVKGQDYRIPFVAHYGQNHRFTTLRKTPEADLGGLWDVVFHTDSLDYAGTVTFVQRDNELKATFNNGRYPYPLMAGTIQADKIYLSRFDGNNAMLVEAKVRPDGSLIGSFRSRLDYKIIWEAKRR